MSEKPQLRLAGLIDRRKPGAWGVSSLCGVMPKQLIFRAPIAVTKGLEPVVKSPKTLIPSLVDRGGQGA